MTCRAFFLLPLLLTLFPAGEEGGNKGELVLGCWSPPRNLDMDYFQFLEELGFSHTLYWRSPKIAPERWRRDLERAQQRNIKLIFDSWQPDAIPEEWLDAVLATACSGPAFGGVYAPDESGYRYPLEGEARRPSLERFRSAYEKLQQCEQGVLFHVDAQMLPRSAGSKNSCLTAPLSVWTSIPTRRESTGGSASSPPHNRQCNWPRVVPYGWSFKDTDERTGTTMRLGVCDSRWTRRPIRDLPPLSCLRWLLLRWIQVPTACGGGLLNSMTGATPTIVVSSFSSPRFTANSGNPNGDVSVTMMRSGDDP